MDFLTNYEGIYSENIHTSDDLRDDDEYFDLREQFNGKFGPIKPIDIKDDNILFICEKPYKDSYAAVHGDVGKFSEIFFEEYALPNNQVYPTFGKYGFNEDHSLKLSIAPSYFSQTKYVHTGIKEANSTRWCDEFEKEEVCNARRNMTASKIMITDEGNWQLTSAPFGQRSPMYCQSRYYNFDENGYCRSDFTPFIKGTYMSCHKAFEILKDYYHANIWCWYHMGESPCKRCKDPSGMLSEPESVEEVELLGSIAKDDWNYHLGVQLRRGHFHRYHYVYYPKRIFDFYWGLWDKIYSPGPLGSRIVLTKNKLLKDVTTSMKLGFMCQFNIDRPDSVKKLY
ncbi:unnamed protein product [Caenorhabditis bovis]|uniref:Uncharacterized protein n=1 Tax=Caenorhabditis bovis TaxID=2654633 RepID=A0A8S1EVM7_9PELO|nr:unnamed protein product [Caenorhabditis bovis]